MRVKFLQDYRGKDTEELFYLKDSVVDLPVGVANSVIAGGRAEAVASEGDGLANSQASDDGMPEFETVEEPVKAKKSKKAAIYG